MQPFHSLSLVVLQYYNLLVKRYCMHCIVMYDKNGGAWLCTATENDTLALRGNSIATKAVEAYMKLVGRKVGTSNAADGASLLFCEIVFVSLAFRSNKMVHRSSSDLLLVL